MTSLWSLFLSRSLSLHLRCCRRTEWFSVFYDIVSFRIVSRCINFFALLFFVEDVGFLYSSTLLIANALLFIFPFWFSASHGPLLMNNYYSKYLVYIVHLHSLFNYAIRILINPNSFFFLSFVVAVGHRPKNGVTNVYCAQHHSSRKKKNIKNLVEMNRMKFLMISLINILIAV